MAEEATNICPNCGYEYHSWVEGCPDCGAALVPTPRPEDAPEPVFRAEEDPHWTLVANLPNSIMGSFIKSRLEAEGIPVLMFRAKSADIAEFSHNDYVPQDLLVPQAMWQRARDIVYPPGGSSQPLYDEWDEEEGDEDPEDEHSSEGSEDGTYTYAPGGAASELPSGWYWADEPEFQPGKRFTHRSWGKGSQVEEVEQTEEESDEPLERDKERFGQEDYRSHDYEYQSGGWTQPSRLTRIMYGVLLLVLTLPFLIQVFQYLFSIFSRTP
jgi:hypothetical protein